MYQIFAGDKIVYSPGGISARFAALSPKYAQELNKAGQVSFTVIPGNQCYDSLQRLTTPVTVYRDGEAVFYGRVYAVEQTFYKDKAVICEGALAFLNDVIIRPFEFRNQSSTCVKKYLDYILDRYNAGCGNEDWKKIYTGRVTVTESNNNLYRTKDGYNPALSVLMDHTINSTLGGYLSTRRSGDKTYLDYTAEPGGQSSQRVMYGRNLLDLKEAISAEGLYTVLIPIGKDGLTIESVNGGKDYIESAEGIAAHGRIWATKKYDDITTAAALLAAARKDLAVGINETVSIELSAVDLSVIGIEADALNCGDSVPVYSAPHEINTYLTCNRIDLSLDDPTASRYTVGATVKRLTDYVQK